MGGGKTFPNLDEFSRQAGLERARLIDAWLRVWTGILFPGKTPEQLLELAKQDRIKKVLRDGQPHRTELHVDGRFVAFIELTPTFRTTV